jgi:glycosyltransferase involved in cell wall biosynthesis
MKQKYVDGLSIVIPSFNRSIQLKRLLDSIFDQNHSNLYEIIVVDNNSDYDIYDVLKKYPKKKLRIIRNVFNIHMASNVMSAFLHCETKWMWLISDDDVVCKDAFSIIEKKIIENSNVCYLKFSTEGINIGLEKNLKVNNLEEFIDYYNNDKLIRRGNLVFVSNGVFNLDKIYPYLGFGFEFSYTYIPHLIPVFMNLNNNIPMVFCEEKIIEYKHPENGTWSFAKVGLGLSTLSHLPLKLDNKYFKFFLNITMCVTYRSLFSFLLDNEINNSRRIYTNVYYNVYRYYLTPFQKAVSIVFSLLLIFPKFSKGLISKVKYKKQ